MKFSTLAFAAASAQLAAAHATIGWTWVNGKDAGRGDANNAKERAYVRALRNNDPITDVTSPFMTCGNPGTAAPRVVKVKSGDKVDLEWFHNSRNDDIIADSHHGPTQIYIAPARSGGKGPVWVKIASDGFNNGAWGVDRLIKAKGKQSFTFPKIAAGDYLVRSEIIALHEGNRLNGAQFYANCVQVRNSATGGKVRSR